MNPKEICKHDYKQYLYQPPSQGMEGSNESGFAPRLMARCTKCGHEKFIRILPRV